MATVVTDSEAGRRLLLTGLPWTAIAVLILVPWSVLARAVAGPVAAPWIVILVTLLGSAPLGESRILEVITHLLPATPLGGRLDTVPAVSDWVYGGVHAAAVTAVTSVIRRRYR